MQPLVIKSYSKEFSSYDETFIRDVPREYRGLVPFMKDGIVLDIGGHIGIFSALAVNSGAAKVAYVEPTAITRKHARKNLAPAIKAGIVDFHEGGVTADPKQKEVILRYFADASGMAGATTVESVEKGPRHWRGRPYTWERFPAIQFDWLMQHYEPTVIKLDCEGMEYPILESIKKMPDQVRALAMEWHGTAGKNIARYLVCTAKLRKWGFKPEREQAKLNVVYDDDGVAIGSNQRMLRPITWKRFQ